MKILNSVLAISLFLTHAAFAESYRCNYSVETKLGHTVLDMVLATDSQATGELRMDAYYTQQPHHHIKLFSSERKITEAKKSKNGLTVKILSQKDEDKTTTDGWIFVNKEDLTDSKIQFKGTKAEPIKCRLSTLTAAQLQDHESLE
jgi:hypothetical protein